MMGLARPTSARLGLPVAGMNEKGRIDPPLDRVDRLIVPFQPLNALLSFALLGRRR